MDTATAGVYMGQLREAGGDWEKFTKMLTMFAMQYSEAYCVPEGQEEKSGVPDGIFVEGLPDDSPQVLNVTHFNTEGVYHCDQVAVTDKCLYKGDCVPTPHCPREDGREMH